MLANIPKRHQLTAGAIWWNDFAIRSRESKFLIIVFVQLGN